MTRGAVHHRGEVLRHVVDAANERRDGVLPMELSGVAEHIGDEFAVIAALQLRWHTRLAGSIERNLVEEPMEPESAVVDAWRSTAAELVGVREILDVHRSAPATPEIAEALTKAHAKDAVLMAAMAGQTGVSAAGSVHVGERLEERARATYDAQATPRHRAAEQQDRPASSLLGRLKAHLAA